MDWNAIKTEYVTTDTSYRKLAQKYGVSCTQICNRAQKDSWVKAREQFLSKTYAKTVEKISSDHVRKAAKVQSIADKLLAKIERAVDSLPDGEMTTKEFRQISASLKDIKDIQMIKSDADIREQEARIANLKRQAEQEDDESGEVRIIFEKEEQKSWAE